MIVEAFVSSVNQSIETVIVEIRIQIAWSLKDGFLNKTATCQVLLQRSEEMKITWCEIRAVGRVPHDAPTFRPLYRYHTEKKHLPPNIALNAGETIPFACLITLRTSIADHISANAAIF
ncbi:hypothetical protein AVEN_274104-1 [Araneus ventricosus]|uniref:Uncharacterized protein n=1 Tax=Araneus ventricosus TaxID=182803 RepID=A0A4Y2C276_ARAVE|nr:hypothetical protein AVEN_274104-1 [Araneus ventricosus]